MRYFKENELEKYSVKLANRQSIKIDTIYLNAYALKKYKTNYIDNQTKVNADILELSEKYQTTKTRDIYMLIISETLPLKEKKEYLKNHIKEISKFV